MNDKVGIEIFPGDFIVYGHLLGRCAGLRIGRVVSTETIPVDRERGYLREEYRIRVRGVDSEWKHKSPKLLSRDSTLLFPDRVVVVATVPPEIKKLFRELDIRELDNET